MLSGAMQQAQKTVWKLTLCLLATLCSSLFAQIPTFPINGIADPRPSAYVFTNARIVIAPGKTLERGSLLIANGRIIAVGPSVTIPPAAAVIDLNGKTIYPAFIDLDTDYGVPRPPKRERRWDAGPQMKSKRKEAFGWNDALHPERRAVEHFTPQPDAARRYRRMGFGAVLTFQHDGIARGTAALVATDTGRKANPMILLPDAAATFSFDKGSSLQDYPSSLMGAIALLRQTYLDAAWYQNGGWKAAYNLTLEAWNRLQSLPQIFEVRDKLDILRADKIGDEFGIQYIIRSAGDAYQRLKEVKATNAPLIVPLNFPLPYDVDDPFDAARAPFAQLKHWELAPRNPALLYQAGIPFALTSAGIQSPKTFWENLRKAVRYGLPKDAALAALTTIPAQLIRADSLLGTLEPGKLANFFIADGDIFTQPATIYQHWVLGKPLEFFPLNADHLLGTYTLKLDTLTHWRLRIAGTVAHPKALLILDSATHIRGKLERKQQLLTLTFPMDTLWQGTLQLTGWWQDSLLSGKAHLPTGIWTHWEARWQEPVARDSVQDTVDLSSLGPILYPFAPFGWDTLPQPRTYLIRNATIWTNEAEGILHNADLLIQGGKIAAVGKNLSAPADAIIIDATGKHVTPGIVDEHSHIAISRGVNEATEAVTAEVRIGDVINSEDVNIYRALAGGVTTVHLLHGSANPIGGQTALIKTRWGFPPEQLKFQEAAPFIKFALGENVKQSNWGDKYTVRYPQTRMGVEQVFRDAFTRAQEYEHQWQRWKANGKSADGIPPRRNLELEALVEILHGKRFITCHSYVQSEILALMRVAEDFGFRINTFTHILEGYKVAQELKAHGAAASTFSDWWAYKYEVIEAIPYNAALLTRVGVLTAINSDSPETGRRLNQEAAKAVKYGGLSEEEALKLVTLNPAKMLHIEDRVGSIRVGKDADIVIWSDDPLSIYAKAEKTFVDGILFYDIERDQQLRTAIAQERQRLIQKMLAAKKNGSPTRKVNAPSERLYHCMDRQP